MISPAEKSGMAAGGVGDGVGDGVGSGVGVAVGVGEGVAVGRSVGAWSAGMVQAPRVSASSSPVGTRSVRTPSG
jgi:hypothetical protein